jgi:hypothetical protein
VVAYLSWVSAGKGGHTVISLRIWQLFKTALPCPLYLIKRAVNRQQTSYQHWCGRAGGFPITRHSTSLDRNSPCSSAQPRGKKWNHAAAQWSNMTKRLICLHSMSALGSYDHFLSNVVKQNDRVATTRSAVNIRATNYTTNSPA